MGKRQYDEETRNENAYCIIFSKNPLPWAVVALDQVELLVLVVAVADLAEYFAVEMVVVDAIDLSAVLNL